MLSQTARNANAPSERYLEKGMSLMALTGPPFLAVAIDDSPSEETYSPEEFRNNIPDR